MSTAAAHLTPKNPTTGEPLAPVARTPLAAIDGIVAQARAAQQSWGRLDIDGRIAALGRFGARLADEAVVERLARSITAEMGKPIRESRGEVRNVARRLVAFGERARVAAAEEVAREGGIEVRVRWRPLGVAAVIAPWNYPVATPSNLILSALLTGNAIVFKPSELTPGTGAILHEVLAETLPEGLVGLVQGAGAEGAALVASDVDLIAFTGSIATGQSIMRSAADGLKRLVLELGGKDPMIILPGADLEAATRHAAIEAVRNAGQACVAVERVIVHASLVDEFLERAKALIATLKVGDPMDEKTDIGPMASRAQREWVVHQVASARAQGARVVVEGRSREPGFFLEPTIITDLRQEMSLVREETFGPVVAVEVCSGADEAIAWANGTHYGLGASIWGPAGEPLDRLAERLEAGMIGVNRGLSAAAGGPWVGWKRSGIGYSRSVAGMRNFMQPQSFSRTVGAGT
ncbi:MAG: aldehyde dehydrogenase [Myxococcales bacterium]|nr:aldehyde dehydrogenase [Myxococcales bacterium]